MATKKPKTIPFRRKREGKTDYSKRLRLLLSNKPRLVVRITKSKIIAQIIKFNHEGDKVLLGLDSSSLKDFGWEYSFNNLPAAYLAGLILGKKAIEKGHKEVVLDTGFKSMLKKGKLSAFLKGLIDSGMDVPHVSEEVFPSEKRLSGEHIVEYANKIKSDNKKYEQIFSGYIKKKLSPEKMVDNFNVTKDKIMG